jgi:exonuclease SbcC
LALSDFRSIDGTIVLPLDAPIVLIHGPNGSGKTSIATALELALTGDVAGLRRSDENVQSYLVHRKATKATVSLKVEGLERPETTVEVEGGKISGRALLDPIERQFFAERCYLSQSTLGRLLDIYQDPTSRDVSNTPLTRFVKDLLGLDQLEALIDGVHDAGDRRRMVKLSPEYDRTEALLTRLKAEEQEGREVDQAANARISELSAAFVDYREQFDLPDDLGRAAAALAKHSEAATVTATQAHLQELDALRRHWDSLPSELDATHRAKIEAEESESAKEWEEYRDGPGSSLSQIIKSLSASFPNLPDPDESDPEAVRIEATNMVEREIARLEQSASSGKVAAENVAKTDHELEQLRARVAVLDGQISQTSGDQGGLGQALAALLPHVQNDECPVCGRDFGEISETSLRAHISQEIARLVEEAEKLQSLIKERQNAQSRLAQLDRERGTQAAGVLTPQVIAQQQQRLASMRSARDALTDLTGETARGAAIQIRYREAVAAAGRYRVRETSIADIRERLNSLAAEAQLTPPAETETTLEAISRLRDLLTASESHLISLQSARSAAVEVIGELQSLGQASSKRAAESAAREKRIRQITAALRAVKQERDLANGIARAAADARTTIVGRVFNRRLNSIWRDLFVRLAPNEPFVPAFMLPKNDGSPIKAMLETVHRDGGRGGRPGAMLSSGNLNTAALTLFLALHLSVKSQLPWLVLDDPVQSMDELHIAQFAALLRTLAKREERQIIVAIHEKPLFDYLVLELSPAFAGDRLATVEISKTAAGATRYVSDVIGFEPDRLVA